MNSMIIVHTHGKVRETLDTIESIQHYITKNVLLLVDGAGWHYYKNEESIPILKGLHHGYGKSPYKNCMLGLIHAYKNWDCDWYGYMEYDTLVGSAKILKDLETAQNNGIWLLGSDFRDRQNFAGSRTVKLDLLEAFLKKEIREVWYLLGAVMFLHKNFMKKLMENDLLEKLLSLTNDFKQDFFPNYTHSSKAAWDVWEHLIPTLVNFFGGKVAQLSCWDKTKWAGDKAYPIRWQPEICLEECENASIIHPVKSYMGAPRVFHRGKRHANS